MTLIASRPSLLHTAVQDLYGGKTDAADRLPKLAAAATDPELAELLLSEAGRAREQARRLAGSGAKAGGPKNLWMAGILDDAERDTRQTEPGALLDIALVGAVRKAKAAEIVSSDTAIALAGTTDAKAIGDAVAANRAEEIDTDRSLKAVLERLA